jgi:hypothetical protein
MAKTKTTTHKFYVVDLVRNKPKTQFIEIPAYRVDVQIDVTTTGILSAADVPSAAMKRLEDAARVALQRYEDVIAAEAGRLDAKIVGLMATPSEKAQSEALALIQGVNQSIRNALASAQGAADKVVDERLKKEAQGDKNLKEARVRTAVKVGGAVISISTAVAKLVATMGADVSSYLAIGKTLVTMGLEINQQIKNEEKLRKDLVDGVQAYISLRGTTLKQAATRQGVDMSGVDISHPLDAIKKIALKVKAGGAEVLKGRDAQGVATEVMDFVVKGIKSKMSDAEKARILYRNHTAKTRERTDALSLKADDLMKATKASKTLKDGVKLGAQCMALKREVSGLATKLTERERFLDEMQRLMQGNGLTIDDRTTIDKLKELDKTTLASSAQEIASNIKSIYELVSALA